MELHRKIFYSWTALCVDQFDNPDRYMKQNLVGIYPLSQSGNSVESRFLDEFMVIYWA